MCDRKRLIIDQNARLTKTLTNLSGLSQAQPIKSLKRRVGYGMQTIHEANKQQVMDKNMEISN